MFKIVQMVPALGWGGAQVFCIQLCNELANYPGYEVTLISMYDHDPSVHLPLDLLDKRVKFKTLGKHSGPDYKIFSRIHKLLEELQPDVVHTHLHTGYYCFLAYLRMKGRIFKKIHTFHNLVKKDIPWYGRRAYYYFFKKNIIHPVSISEEVYKSAVAEFGSTIKTLIHNGSIPVTATAAINEVTATVNGLKKNSDTKVLINVARISKQKNQQLLLDCMRTLETEHANVIALILGDYTPDNKSLYDHLVQHKPANVHFMGKIKNVGDYYLNADAFVLSSIYEGLPISLLEAISAGVIPACTPAGGVVNIVNKDTGFLSKDISFSAFLDTLKKYLSTGKEEIERMRSNCKKLYEQEYSMESCASRYNELYKS